MSHFAAALTQIIGLMCFRHDQLKIDARRTSQPGPVKRWRLQHQSLATSSEICNATFLGDCEPSTSLLGLSYE
eukprot:scaffold647981_cov27-Prasinocladus_malaysianus.AAC.2